MSTVRSISHRWEVLSLTNNKQQSNGSHIKLSVLKRLGSYLWRHKGLLFLAFLLMLASNLLALVAPALSGNAIDAIELGKGRVDFDKVIFYCVLMIVFYILSALFSYALSILMIHISQKITYTMRKEVFDHLLDLKVGYFDTNQTGNIVSHLSYDIDTVNASLSNDLLQICAGVVTVIGSFIMMLSISPVLILVFAVTLPISIGFTKYKSTKVRPLFKRRSAKLGELNGYAEEMLSGQKTIKAYRREERIIERFDRKNTDAVDAYYEADYQGCMIGPSVNFINNLSMSFISMFGAMLYLFGQITLGNVSSFIMYSRKFAGPINELANIMAELQSACAAAERIFELLDEEPEKLDSVDASELCDVEGQVDIEHVAFGYTHEKRIIHDMNLSVKPGNIIAIVGPTGAGKTTIINLLMRFYDPDSGTICLDENNIIEVTRKSLRAAYTMVLQDTWLFCGSIFDNISYGKEGATLEEVQKAAKAAKIHDYIESLPDGYDTILSDDGVNISKGQKQLITIARAMLADSSMLILDEATSNVDSRTEQQIQDVMYKLMEGRTCFVIAHRLSTIQNADLILVIKNGNIIEQGTHDSLLKTGGFYASLYNAQFDT